MIILEAPQTIKAIASDVNCMLKLDAKALTAKDTVGCEPRKGSYPAGVKLETLPLTGVHSAKRCYVDPGGELLPQSC